MNEMWTDQPILGAQSDRLNFSHYADVLTKVVLTADTPITVGVFGSWGGGKTSLMRLIAEQLISRRTTGHRWARTEEEWEKAARGEDGRVFPWGNDFDPQRANVRESGIGNTTPVGVYPDGASPYGLLDCAGNVWEWTASQAGEGQIVIRGGSWSFYAVDARCFAREISHPGNRSNRIGFRVVTGPQPEEGVRSSE